jgi:integrase
MLSEAVVRKLQPRESAYRVFDQCGIAGFGVQVTPAGGRGYFLRYIYEGKRRYLTLGHFPHTPLSAAREKARVARSQIDQGIDPQARAVSTATGGSLESLIVAWLVHQQEKGRRTLGEVERALRHNVPPELLARPAASITPGDIRAVLAAIHQRGSRVMANRVRSALHTCFQYGLQHDHDPRTLRQAVLFGLTTNPVTAIPKDGGAEKVGERSLTWDEVRAVWHSESLTWLARQAVRLLLLTGARVNEIVQARWDEFDLEGGLWTLPAERHKGKRTLLTPSTPLMIELLVELREAYPGDYLFPARSVAGSNAPWGDTALNHAIRNAGYDWTGRDLRRTWKTLAGECGLSLEIRNRIQGHALQDVGSRHYDRHGYLAEKRAALMVWERELRARGG